MNVEKLAGQLMIGQTIVLELIEEIVVGELIVKKLPSHLRLKNCRDYKTNEDLGLNNIYYLNEIKNIKVFREQSKDKQTEEVTTHSSHKNTNVSKSKNSISIDIRTETSSKIQNLTTKHIFIDRYDSKYFDACKDMQNSRQISISLEDVRFGRRSKASIIIVGTDNRIYIFDLLSLNGINKELKSILESKSICKVIHNSKMTYDYLKYACNIKLHFVFDTMMAYFYVSGTREALTVNELITQIFNLPYIEPSKNIIWDSRPISKETLCQAAFSVAFLIEVQQYLMHRHLLKSFYSASAAAMYSFSSKDEYPYTIKGVNENEIVEGVKFDLNLDEKIDLRENHVEKCQIDDNSVNGESESASYHSYD
uniref:CSON005227 protein n=1 Tax=Culicoides sonorensis TaxID=179676 RepID=A0A336MQF4_CULSO